MLWAMKTGFASHTFTRVAPYLYRTEVDKYYGRIKRNGKIHQKSLETAEYETAKRKLRDFIKEIETKAVEVPDITFEEASKLWLESLYGLKASSKLRRETCLHGLLPIFKGKKLRAITKHDLNVWASKRAKEVSARTFNVDRETLSMLFEYGMKTLGILTVNHAKELSKMKQKKVHVVPPTREQFAELVAFLDKSKRLNTEDKSRNAALFVRFLAYTGLRLDEARHVCWQHVDFAKGTLLVTGGASGTKNLSQRTIPLFPPVRELLESFPKADRKELSPIFKINTAKMVLITASSAMGRRAGEHYGHHDMRHFFCSNALEESVPDHVIASWLGHKDGGILVRNTYGHLRKSYGDEMAKKMTFKS